MAPRQAACCRNRRQRTGASPSVRLARRAQGRSFPGQEAASGVPHPSGHAPAPPALKIDAGLMDRLTDEVIRRVERCARIERARRGRRGLHEPDATQEGNHHGP